MSIDSSGCSNFTSRFSARVSMQASPVPVGRLQALFPLTHRVALEREFHVIDCDTVLRVPIVLRHLIVGATEPKAQCEADRHPPSSH